MSHSNGVYSGSPEGEGGLLPLPARGSRGEGESLGQLRDLLLLQVCCDGRPGELGRRGEGEEEEEGERWREEEEGGGGGGRRKEEGEEEEKEEEGTQRRNR